MIVNELVLGKRYIYNYYECTLVGISKDDIGYCNVLLKFNCRHPYHGSSYDVYKDLDYDIIKYEGVACPFGLFKEELTTFLKPYEVKVKATDLAKFMYPTAKEEDGFLILEDF
jgi:hypothetical protein